MWVWERVRRRVPTLTGGTPFLVILFLHTCGANFSWVPLVTGAHIKDMEASGIAWSCALHAVPHFGVKVVTEIVDGDVPTPKQFMENLSKAAEALQFAVPKVLDYVCGNHS
mmetsp:Transcript_1271/g.2760  ORF Transcript_1271/g.2760 Transcript_1271/m.2760 type:complete len:111 (-) Transcript_1271:74-406(-)